MSWGLAGPRPSLTAQYPIPSSPKPEECMRVSGGFPKLGAFCGLGWYAASPRWQWVQLQRASQFLETHTVVPTDLLRTHH